jgi:eukaryotic-like serine/threonine-protein kinase
LNDQRQKPSADQRRAVETIFHKAADAPREQRTAMLEALCAGDAVVMSEVRSLLAQFDAGTLDVLRHSPAQAAQAASSVVEKPGDRLGNYVIEGVLGEGGFGMVYIAEQTHPVRRKVALKVLKAGMDTAGVLARFDAERQALALMDHPSIATVLDAGSTPSGRPFFVMELVSGVPLNKFCDEQTLGTRARLELFVEVCRAVQHAHQKGVIHRDLKPSNILVSQSDGRPRPKVIDFGIAKATSATLSENPAFTAQDQIMGTPEYMSPEQAVSGGRDIDTRTDVYSLGVILYELMSGALPFDPGTLRSGGIAQMQKLIREVDPPRPSTRLSTLEPVAATEAAANRGADLATLRRTLRGDLEWIIARAMDKDRARRYDSAAALAADIERHLRSEPVVARPPTTAYRVAKFARRNKGAVAAGTAVTAALLAGLAFASVGFVRASAERDRALGAEAQARASREAAESARLTAEREAAKAGAVNDFLLQRMLSAANPWQDGRDVTVAKVLDTAASQIDERFGDQPDVRAAVQHTLGQAYQRLARIDDAERFLTEAFEWRRTNLGADHPETLDTELRREAVLMARSTENQTPRLDALLARLERVLGPDHATTLEALSVRASLHTRFREHAKAVEDARRLVEARRRVMGDASEETFSARSALALALSAAGELAESLSIIDAALAEVRERFGPRSARAADLLISRSNVLSTMGDAENAEIAAREAIDICRVVFGDTHPHTLIALNNIANALRHQGKVEESIVAYEESLAALDRAHGPTHDWTLTVRTNYANALTRSKRFDEARAALESVLETRRAKQGPDHADTAMAMEALALLENRTKNRARAAELQESAVRIARASLGEKHPDFLNMLANLGSILQDSGRTSEAEPVLREIVALETAEFGPDHRYTLTDQLALAEVLVSNGSAREAEQIAMSALATITRAHPKHTGLNSRMRLALASALLAQGRTDEARTPADEAYAIATAMPDDDSSKPDRLRNAAAMLAKIADAAGKPDEAAQWREKHPQAENK